MHSIIYVMRHIDIGGYVDIPYKKVGITGAGKATLTSRLQQISNTKSPIKAQCVAAWEHQDAKAIESALHSLMEDSRVEGEWFLDKEDTLVERMRPIMELIGATELAIEESDDVYTKTILQKEEDAQQKTSHILLGEISKLLKNPISSSSRKRGATFFSKDKGLTYYINARKSGRHQLLLGKSADVFDDIKQFIESCGYDVDQGTKGGARVMGVTSEEVAEIINAIERDYKPV